jgi:hypothetical protein
MTQWRIGALLGAALAVAAWPPAIVAAAERAARARVTAARFVMVLLVVS